MPKLIIDTIVLLCGSVMGMTHYSRKSAVDAILELLEHTFNITPYFLLVTLQFTLQMLKTNSL